MQKESTYVLKESEFIYLNKFVLILCFLVYHDVTMRFKKFYEHSSSIFTYYIYFIQNQKSESSCLGL